jgi:phosphatidate cytidylyltransferase
MDFLQPTATVPLLVYTALSLGLVVLLVATSAVARISAAWAPIRTWLVVLPLALAAIWLGPFVWGAFVTVVAIFGFKEFARATGLYRHRAFVLVVYASIVGLNLAAFAQLYDIFLALPMWAVVLLALVPIGLNRAEGMLQWFSLAVVGLTFYAFFLAHLTWLRSTEVGLGFLLYVTLATELNDIAAFLYGKRFGRHHWTVLSPNKTVEGSLLALATTMALTFAQWPIAFPHVPAWGVLLAGIIVGIGGQVGDLTMAMVKRNVGIKDFGQLLPGHGGITDRVNSLMITAPIFAHAMGFLFGGFPR